MIKVKNVSSCTVAIISPDLRFRRKLTPGRELPLSKEVYDELCFDTGFQTLVSVGMIRITGAQEEESEVVKSERTVLSREEIAAIFEAKDYSKFSAALKDASPATKESIVAIAIENRVVDNGFVSLIGKYCGVDVLDAIAKQAE